MPLNTATVRAGRHFFPDVFHRCKATFFVSFSHFLLLFGYKMFSLYYPLFLAMQGFSPKIIGSMYLLIYFTIAVASPALNFYARRHNISLFLALSILGYGVYSLGMIYSRDVVEFALFQILLGVSSGLFYISARTIIIEAGASKPEESFAYFYSAPLYSSLLAPAIGGLIILWAGFDAVFFVSVAVYIVAAIVSYLSLRGCIIPTRRYAFKEYVRSYARMATYVKRDRGFFVLLSAAFVSLLLMGAYRAFFVLFLRSTGLTEGIVVTFVAAEAVVSILLSWRLAKAAGAYGGAKDILAGTSISGVFTVALSYLSNVYALFLVNMGDFAGKFLSESGKSGWLAKKFRDYSEEAATLDTVLTSLGVAFGALAGGYIVDAFGYRALFMAAGAVCVVVGIVGWIKYQDLGWR